MRQLLVYHSLVLVQKTLVEQTPSYLYSRVNSQLHQLQTGSVYPYRIRNQTHGVSRRVPQAEARLELTERRWFWNSVKMYNNLPASVKNEANMKKLKIKLKTWVTANISLV